ncbi:MAG TPA: Ppx/GppA phosphatase family protein [Spirochaetia bacterium]|nr:Ppx/GppA phosphatase family protein [Spirochaetia bacterium]
MPLRVAAVDVGTNAIRFLAVELDGEVPARTLSDKRFPVRIGHGVYSTGHISPDAASAAVESLTTVAASLKELGVEKYRAVATSAVRESSDRRRFLRSVRERTGLVVEVISGAEEMRLVHKAVRRRLLLGPDRWILVELGGGSLEVALVDADKVHWCETRAMGAVRLRELFAPGGTEPRGFSRIVAEYVGSLRLPPHAREAKTRGFIATGGNIEALARLAAPAHDAGAPARIPLPALRKITEELAKLPVAERTRFYDLKPDRADVIVPAALMYVYLAELLHAEELIVPGGGIREGIIEDLGEKLTARREPGVDDVIEDAAALGRKFSFEEGHSVHVARLAVQLFDQLSSLHGLGRRERRILAAAAVLHDIGDFVSLKSHHKHSAYLIARSELPGFTSTEMFLVANVARYHRKGGPSLAHPQFVLLSPADRDRVRRLAALIRIADALDREHRGRIRRISLLLRDSGFVITTGEKDDLLLERWALEKKSDVFRKVFGVDMTLAASSEAADG